VRLALWVASLALLGRDHLVAQQVGHLAGIVTDSSGASIPAASITVVNEDTGFRRTATAREDGGYRVPSLAPGNYKVTIRKDGFKTAVHFGIKLDPTQLARVDFVLEVGPMQETITVESSPTVLQSEDASVGTLVGREWIDRIPVNGRGLQSLLELAPGTVATPATRGEPGQFTANGQRPNSHYFTVDGVSVNTGVSAGGGPAGVTGGVLPGMTAFGSFHNLVSMEALDEFRIQTSTAVPEYGRLPGAQVALSSRSGTNDFHGSGFEYFRNQRLDANDWFANWTGQRRAKSSLHDFGATLGGPIRRNRAFFFAAHENIRLDQPFLWRIPVPSDSIRASAPPRLKPLLDPFPRSNGPVLGPDTAEWIGTVNRPSRLASGSLRADLALTQRVTLFGRFNEAPSSTEHGSWQVNHLDIESRSVTGGANARITANVLQDFRFNFNRSSAESEWRAAGGADPCAFAAAVIAVSQQRDDACGSFYVVAVSGMGQALAGRENRTEQEQWNLAETVTWTRSSHQVRFGADYRRLVPRRPQTTNYVTLMADSLTDLLTQGNIWSSVAGAAESSALLRELSIYGQDSWRVTPRLTLNLGLRWEFNPPPIQRRPQLGSGPFPGGISPGVVTSSIWPLRYNNLAPRFAGAYRLTRNGRTVLRGGYGLFYDSSLGISTDIVHGRPATSWQIGGPGGDATGSPRRIIDYNFDPSLRLPQIRQWNVTVEKSFEGGGVASLGYVGSEGRDLLRRELTGRASTNFVGFALATNNGRSEYHGFQAQYRRRMAARAQALVSYSWSHSIDNGSTDANFYWTGAGTEGTSDRGSSDFDVRQAFNAAFSFEAPSGHGWRRITGEWSLDGVVRARTGFPINIQNNEFAMGVGFANVFRPDYRGGRVWIADGRAPGGRRLNGDAFRSAGQFQQGSLGRNAVAGLGMAQLDIAARREFKTTERTALQVRVEAFNALNRANLGDPVRFLASPLFGQSVSMLNQMLGSGTPGSGLTPRFQAGGPRSVQLVVKFRF
jgi:hypothetical protein